MCVWVGEGGGRKRDVLSSLVKLCTDPQVGDEDAIYKEAKKGRRGKGGGGAERMRERLID